MKWFKKKIEAPSGETIQLEGMRTWTVRWESVLADWPSIVRQQEVQMFPNPESAEHFAKSLRDALKILRYQALDEVKVEVQNP